MRRSTENRQIEYRGTPGGALERVVTLPDGREYAHRCSEDIFRQVATYLDDHVTASGSGGGSAGFTMTSVADAIDAPLTQVNVALELLKERGMILTSGRRGYIEEGYRDGVYEHALVEFYALIEGHPPEYRDG